MIEALPIIRLPFSICYVSGIEERKIVIKVVAQSPLRDQHREALDKKINEFIHAAEYGMFCGTEFHPAQSHLILVHRNNDGLNCMEWHCLACGLDPGAFYVLRGMMLYYSYYDRPLASVSVTAESPFHFEKFCAPKPRYPGLYHQISFEVVEEKPWRLDKHRRFTIEFTHILSDKEIRVLLAAVEFWSPICRGGFPNEGKEPFRTGIAPGEVYMIDEYTVEHVIDYFEASEEAFNAVVNLGARLHYTICPVQRVTIY